MGYPQWEGGVGIALASSASQEVSAPVIYIVCDAAKITRVPILYERNPNYIPDTDHIVPAGFTYSFSASGITGSCKQLGYLLFLWCGGNTFASQRQTIFPNDAGVFCNFFLDPGYSETGGSTKLLIGARVTKLTLAMNEKSMWVWSMEGVACDAGDNIASLSPSIPLGADNAPLSWVHFQDATGFVKVGVNGGVAVQDDSVKSWEIELSRNAIPSGVSIGSNQPTDMVLGRRSIGFKIMKELNSLDATTNAQIAAFYAQQTIALDVKAIVGVNDFQLTIPAAHFDADPAIEVGAKDDVVKVTFSGKAYKNAAQNILTGVVKDGSSGVYT